MSGRRAVFGAVLLAALVSGGARDAHALGGKRPPVPVVGTMASHPAYQAKSGKLAANVILAPDDLSPDAPRVSVVVLSLDGRTELPLHRQTSAKIIVVVEGEGRVRSAKDKRGSILQKGDAVYVPAGAPFGFLATCCKHGPTKLAIVYLPAGPEQAYLHPDAPRDGSTTPVKAGEDGPTFDVVSPRSLKPTKLVIPGVASGGALDIVATGEAGVAASLMSGGGGAGALEPSPRAALWLVLDGRVHVTPVGGAVTVLGAATAIYLPPRAAPDVRVEAGTHLLIVTFPDPTVTPTREEKKTSP